MALPVLDGNQTATTLSSVVTGGEHIVAHSVVSLGTTAIANITSAVSGAVVTIPALSHLGNSVATDGVADATTSFVKIGGHQSGSNQTAHIVHVSTGGAMSVDATDSVVSISNFPSTQTIAGTVTVGNSVTLGGVENNDPAAFWGEGGAGAPIYALNTGWKDVDGLIGDTSAQNPFPIQVVSSGAFRYFPSSATTAVKVILGFEDGSEWRENNDFQPIPVRIVQTGAYAKTSVTIAGTVTIGNSVTIGSLPSGALTTRFGSVTTANLSQLTSCVTNTSRKYLLAQNISAGTVTIGIGFSPTTTQGIQLTAGGGLTFDAFCPTGAVYWLGATTGATWTILEG